MQIYRTKRNNAKKHLFFDAFSRFFCAFSHFFKGIFTMHFYARAF